MKRGWLKRAWIWWAKPIERSVYFTEEDYQNALRRRRAEFRPFKIGAVVVLLLILANFYPQSLIIGTVIEFAFFAACGAALVYVSLLVYEGKRLPKPPEDALGRWEQYHSSEWDRVNRFSVKAGAVIGITAVLFFGPVTAKQAISYFNQHTTQEPDEDSSTPP
jgi:hypothetical protein